MAEQMANLLASESLSSRSKYLLVLLLKSCIKRNNQFFSRAILRNTAFLEFLQLVLQKGSKLKDPLKRRLFDKPEGSCGIHTSN